MERNAAVVFTAGLFLASMAASGAAETGKDAIKTASGHMAKPQQLEFNEDLLDRLTVPQGFEVSVFAQGLKNPRMMAVADDGTVFVTRQQQNDVIALRDANADGRADDSPRTVFTNLNQVHGIAIHQKQLYLASPTTVWAADMQADGSVDAPRMLTDDLPDGGQHRGRTIAFGPDGLLYIGVGSTCNDCADANPEHATVLRAQPDLKGRTIFARGLRHTQGFDWHPVTGEFWGMDHGADWKGDDVPPEELNLLTEGANYGWPICYGKQVPDEVAVAEPKDIIGQEMTKSAYCSDTQPAVLTYTAHSAPLSMAFYDAQQFPADYRNDAFVVFRGSWNRAMPSGYKVARLRFSDGKPVAFEDFLSGFLNADGKTQFARLAGIAVTKDGALLVSDDSNGVIYQVAYKPERN